MPPREPVEHLLHELLEEVHRSVLEAGVPCASAGRRRGRDHGGHLGGRLREARAVSLSGRHGHVCHAPVLTKTEKRDRQGAVRDDGPRLRRRHVTLCRTRADLAGWPDHRQRGCAAWRNTQGQTLRGFLRPCHLGDLSIGNYVPPSLCVFHRVTLSFGEEGVRLAAAFHVALARPELAVVYSAVQKRVSHLKHAGRRGMWACIGPVLRLRRRRALRSTTKVES
jgi:hypothetical protein